MTDTPAPPPIRTSPGRHWQIVRRRWIPVLVWLAALAFLLQVTERRSLFVDAVGVVERTQVAVSPAFDGVVHRLSVDLLDEVESGQVVALMDDTLLQAELLGAEADLARIRATVDAERERAGLELSGLLGSGLSDAGRLAFDEEEARLDYLDRVVRQESNLIRLEWLNLDQVRQRELAATGVGDESARDEARLAYATLAKEVEENRAVLDAARLRRDLSKQRREGFVPTPKDVDVDALVAPFAQRIRVQEARVQTVKIRRSQLALKAPIDGQINQIFYRPGETVLAGVPLLSVASPDGNRVVAYLDADMLGGLAIGSTAEVRERGRNTVVANARVLRVGAQVDPLPPQLLPTPDFPRWGLPVLVDDVPAGMFRPGTVVDVRIPLLEVPQPN